MFNFFNRHLLGQQLFWLCQFSQSYVTESTVSIKKWVWSFGFWGWGTTIWDAVRFQRRTPSCFIPCVNALFNFKGVHQGVSFNSSAPRCKRTLLWFFLLSRLFDRLLALPSIFILFHFFLKGRSRLSFKSTEDVVRLLRRSAFAFILLILFKAGAGCYLWQRLPRIRLYLLARCWLCRPIWFRNTA